jgi:hypothetical protein
VPLDTVARLREVERPHTTCCLQGKSRSKGFLRGEDVSVVFLDGCCGQQRIWDQHHTNYHELQCILGSRQLNISLLNRQMFFVIVVSVSSWVLLSVHEILQDRIKNNQQATAHVSCQVIIISLLSFNPIVSFCCQSALS